MRYVYLALWYLLLAAVGLGARQVLEVSQVPQISGDRLFLIALVTSLVVHFVFYYLFYWEIPREHRIISGIVVCFTGSFLFVLGAAPLVGGDIRLVVVAAAIGAFLFFFMAVKVGTPNHAHLVVNSDPDPMSLVRPKGAPRTHNFFQTLPFQGPPWVWPLHFSVAQAGTVHWELVGQQGTQVEIRFDQGYDPFDPDSGHPTILRGTVPGHITGAPVVRHGRGAYSIECVDPSTGNKNTVIVHGGDTPRRYR